MIIRVVVLTRPPPVESSRQHYSPKRNFSNVRRPFTRLYDPCVTLLPVALLSGEDLLATTLYGWAMLVGIALADLPAASSVASLLQPVALLA
jgi:hypothetical protein